MKKIGVSTLLLASVMVLSSQAQASCTGGNCVNVTLDRLYIHSNGVIYIDTSGTETDLACTPSGGRYIKLTTTHPARDQIYALLLTAHEAKRPVWVSINTSEAECTLSYIVSDK